MKSVRREYGSEQADRMAHSEGGPTSTLLASRNPELIRSISYTGAAGVDGQNTLRHRASGTVRVLRDEILPNLSAIQADYDPARSMLLDVSAHGIHCIRVIREAIAVAQADDRQGIHELRERHGIRIGAVLLGRDSYFRPQDVLGASHGLYDSIIQLSGAQHIDPVTLPGRHAAVQLDMFAALNPRPALQIVQQPTS
jgi:pimeloyl-ACP methyl ester carboxylesterase